jgi:predicted metalloprotease
MATERVTERIVDRDGGRTTYVDAGGGGSGMAGVIIGIAVLALVAIIAFFVVSAGRNDAIRTNAVTSAASSVADSTATAAKNVSDAATTTANSVNPQK